jgi:hypothetical protein
MRNVHGRPAASARIMSRSFNGAGAKGESSRVHHRRMSRRVLSHSTSINHVRPPPITFDVAQQLLDIIVINSSENRYDPKQFGFIFTKITTEDLVKILLEDVVPPL